MAMGIYPRKRWIHWYWMPVLVMVAGCGSSQDKWTRARPPVYPTSGQVLLDGKPVSQATVTFQATGADGAPGYAMTDDQGHFKAQTYELADGLSEGSYRVAIQKTQMVNNSGSIAEEVREPGSVTEKHFLPEKYSDYETSGIEVTIDANGSNKLEAFDLTKNL